MGDDKLYAGPAIRRARRKAGLTQLAMADALDISASYLNLIERNQRPLSAAVMLRLAKRFDVPLSQLDQDSASVPSLRALRRRLADPVFADLDLDSSDAEALLAENPALATAFARLFDRATSAVETTPGGSAYGSEPAAVRLARLEIERWRNHFADLDAQAEAISEELRLSNQDLYGAIAERLRTRHQIAIRILPVDVMPDQLRRFDIHARQMQLSEMLGPGSRTFQAATMLGQLEARTEIDAITIGSGLASSDATQLFRRHLEHYFAGAVMMPYMRFLRACETSGYDLRLMQARFGVSFEQLAHRLTTLQRVGARGLPFFMLRADRAGEVSKRFMGASEAPLAEPGARCPLWALYDGFSQPDRLVTNVAELEDGSRWVTLAQYVRGPAPPMRTGGAYRAARFVVALGLDARLAAPLASLAGRDIMTGPADPIGLGCTRCLRPSCPQRAAPPANRALAMISRERTISPFSFSGD